MILADIVLLAELLLGVHARRDAHGWTKGDKKGSRIRRAAESVGKIYIEIRSLKQLGQEVSTYFKSREMRLFGACTWMKMHSSGTSGVVIWLFYLISHKSELPGRTPTSINSGPDTSRTYAS